MHEQLRSQILAALTPDHRAAVASAIGDMVIAASPDPSATAKQIDGILSPGEQQKVVSLHETFVTQSQALMQQLHAQLARQGSGAQWYATNASHPMMMMPGANDAGTVVLMVLSHHAPMGMGMIPGHGGMPMGAPGGQPPGGPPPGGPPPLR